MKRTISFIGLIVIAAIGTFLLIPYILSPETIRETMAEQIELATGREVTFSGPASLSVIPALNVSVSGVTIANAPGIEGGPFAAMDQVSASIRLLPLLAGNIEFDQLTMVRPRFNLATDGDGRPNWNFAAQPDTPQAPPAAQQGAPSNTGPAASIAFDEFLIRDGQITYRNGHNGEVFDASSINAAISWPARTAPLNAEGTVVWGGEVADFKVRCDDPLSLAAKGKSPASVMVQTNRITIDVTGQFSTAVDLTVDGQIGLRIPSVPALARWFGIDLPISSGFNDLSLKSKFVAGGPRLSFSDAVLSLDGNAAEGAIMIRFGDARPVLQATLALGTLNLNPYIGAAGEAQQGTRARKKEASDGWSDSEISLAGLGAMDADVRISAGKITAKDVPLGSGALTISLKDKVLTAQVAQLQAYAGEINGSLTVNAAQAPKMALTGAAHQVNLQPLLRDTASFDRLRGQGSVTIDLNASGSSARALIGNLAGSTQIKAANGAIAGIDAVAMIRTLRDRRLDGWSDGKGKETPFDLLQANFAIDRGIARNDDFSLKGPALDITGQGTIDLPEKSLDYKVTAALVERSGSGETATVKTIAKIPAIIRGPWDDPLIVPDPVAMLESSPEARETIEKAKEALKQGDLEGAADAIREKGVGDLLDALTGKDKKTE